MRRLMVDIDTAIFNPAAVFTDPVEILQDKKVKLSLDQKIRALRTWRYDIQLRHVAEEENMHASPYHNDQEDVLEEKILDALNSLEHTTKH